MERQSVNKPLYIVWSDNSMVGVPIIDEQHRGIISTINSLHYFNRTGDADEILKPTLIMLEQYINIHFKTEEALITKANYPALEEHILLHRDLAKNAKGIYYKSDVDMDPDTVLKFLKDWWLNHINNEDRKYIPFLEKLIKTGAF